MRKHLIVTHGTLAEGVKNTLNLFLGNNNNFESICAYIDDVSIDLALDEYINKLDNNDELIIFTDIEGGSVNQIMIKYLIRDNTYIISGFNFPLILQFSVLDDSLFLDEKQIVEIIEESKKSIVFVNKTIKEVVYNEDDE